MVSPDTGSVASTAASTGTRRGSAGGLARRAMRYPTARVGAGRTPGLSWGPRVSAGAWARTFRGRPWHAAAPSCASLRRRMANVSSDSNAGDEILLLRAWHGGDRSAGQALIRRYHDPVTRFFRTKAFHNAEDLVQRTFLALAGARDRFSGESSVRAFLFGIARNVLFEFYRSERKHGPGAPDFAVESLVDLAPGVSTQAAARSEMRVLLQALQRIPADLQSLLELHYWEGLSVDELASVFEIAPGTIKSRMHRARGLLKEEMARVPASPALMHSTRTLYAHWIGSAVGRADAP